MYINTCVNTFRSLSLALINHRFIPRSPIPIQYHRDHSSFLHFHIYNALLWWWETWFPLSFIYLLIWSMPLNIQISGCYGTPTPQHTETPPLPRLGSNIPYPLFILCWCPPYSLGFWHPALGYYPSPCPKWVTSLSTLDFSIQPSAVSHAMPFSSCSGSNRLHRAAHPYLYALHHPHTPTFPH